MSYIIRVIGYNAYWTGNTEPGKLWSFNIDESARFLDREQAQKIVDSGTNMEVVEYESAAPQVVELKPSPDIKWIEVDETLQDIKTKNNQNEEFVNLSPDEFVEDETIEEVDVEVID